MLRQFRSRRLSRLVFNVDSFSAAAVVTVKRASFLVWPRRHKQREAHLHAAF
jgi:hypothetical protein